MALSTNFGDLNFELYAGKAPKACENFLALCKKGYYGQAFLVFYSILKFVIRFIFFSFVFIFSFSSCFPFLIFCSWIVLYAHQINQWVVTGMRGCFCGGFCCAFWEVCQCIHVSWLLKIQAPNKSTISKLTQLAPHRSVWCSWAKGMTS